MTFQQIREAASVGLRNIVSGTSVASLTMASNPRAMMQYLADSLFLHRAMSGRRGVPQKNVSEVFKPAGTVSIRLGNLDTPDAWLWPQALYTQDIVSLCLLCQIIQPKVVFEIGTAQGYTSHHFALNTPDETKIYTLDLPHDLNPSPVLPTTAVDAVHVRELSHNQRFCFDGSPEAQKITRLLGDSATFDFKPYHKRVDLFFIDGAHWYEYARSDTAHALDCCRPGSVIAWHDYGKVSLPGVSRWVDEFTKGRSAYSVPGGSIAFMTVD